MAELIALSNCGLADRAADAIFVHGLDGDAHSTWRVRGAPDGSWPLWLGVDLPDVGIWSLGYDVKALAWRGFSMELVDRAVNTLEELASHGIGARPVYFVAHSFGGLLVKQLLRTGRDSDNPRYRSIPDRTRGVVFLATPHGGSRLANWVKRFIFLRPTVTVSELKASSSLLRNLNEWYRVHHRTLGIRNLVYVETRKYMGALVVDPVSADPGLPDVTPIPMDDDHISITKPRSRQSLIYRGIRDFIRSGNEARRVPVPASTPTELPAKLFGVPNIPDLPFLGREASLRELKGRLGRTRAGGATGGVQELVAVRGWPGVGKTSIVLRLAHERDVHEMFRDGVAWMSLGEDVGADGLVDRLAKCCQKFGSNAALAARRPAEAAEVLTDLLRHRRVLLIVDDVWKLEDIAVFQRATPSSGALLITTRERRIAEDFARENVCYLPELEEGDALELLDRLAPGLVARHPQGCSVLVQNLGRLPLAIHVAGMMLAREFGTGFEVRKLLDELCADTTVILGEKAPPDRIDLDSQVQPTVRYILQRSIERLDARTRYCFACLSIFPPKPNTFALWAMRELWDASDAQAEATVRELVARGLLEPVGGGRYQMHDLLLALARGLVR